MKTIIPLLTWERDSGYDMWMAREYPFKIKKSNSHQVIHYDLYDKENKLDQKWYAVINAQDYAKQLYRKKIKKGEVKLPEKKPLPKKQKEPEPIDEFLANSRLTLRSSDRPRSIFSAVEAASYVSGSITLEAAPSTPPPAPAPASNMGNDTVVAQNVPSPTVAPAPVAQDNPWVSLDAIVDHNPVNAFTSRTLSRPAITNIESEAQAAEEEYISFEEFGEEFGEDE